MSAILILTPLIVGGGWTAISAAAAGAAVALGLTVRSTAKEEIQAAEEEVAVKNSVEVEVKNRMDDPVAPSILAELGKFADFRRAYDEAGMTPEEFDTFGATRRTLRQFCKATDDLVSLVRDIMIPNPDV